MKTIKYNKANLPAQMRVELLACSHAGEAEAIFNAWADTCYIDPKDRAYTWLNV